MNGFFLKIETSHSKMTAASDVTVAQDGQGNVKLHPYLVTLVRWCVSCFWSTATVLLHRLMIAPLQPITGPRSFPSKSKVLKRAAGTEHLHPEPKVECQLLHQPEHHTLDVIFVHGLYGSLGNTWRQGEWRTKYQKEPKKVILRDHSKKCNCQTHTHKTNSQVYNENKSDSDDFNDSKDSEMTFKKINEKLFKKIIPRENDLITEQFYNNTLLDHAEIVDNFETQAQFVRDLFKRENNCDNDCDEKDNENKCNYNEINEVNECKCNEKKCEVGCGCICDDCYSSCWPKDWIRMDFPGARVISINYTSDPYLWRPLWIKENKRLSLHVRAEQMMQQLLEIGVGEKPVIWVGHSKGGLFIKEIYCKAFEAYRKLNKNEEAVNLEPNNENLINRSNSTNNDAVIAETIDNIVGNMFDNKEMYKQNCHMTFNDYMQSNSCVLNETKPNENVYENNRLKENNSNEIEINVTLNNELKNVNVTLKDNENKCNLTDSNENEFSRSNANDAAISSTIEEKTLALRSSLYTQSQGFMFYSVPHRGSPLADIKTPVTARSLELLEISKDCSLVLELHARWAAATSRRRVAVRGVVETTRTLMSVLWLRIVSLHSADAGIGTLLGVSVDHREICKPSSRRCLLYTELTDLIREALSSCKC